jgi:hypothetical protein
VKGGSWRHVAPLDVSIIMVDDNVVNIGDGHGDQEGEDESDDVMMGWDSNDFFERRCEDQREEGMRVHISS